MKPKIAALITASGGIGSHFVLHKLQGHKNIITLKESAFRNQGGTTKGDFKNYLANPDHFPSKQLHSEQLLPKKDFAFCNQLFLVLYFI